MFIYVFNFPNSTRAYIDPIVGPYLAVATPSVTALNVYDLRQGGVVTASGFWALILTDFEIPALNNSPFMAFLLDQNQFQLTPSGVLGCIVSNVPAGFLKNVEIVTPYGVFIPTGLIPPFTPPPGGRVPTYPELGF